MKLVFETKKIAAIFGRCLTFVLVLSPFIVFGDRFLDDDLNYSFEYGSTTRVYVSGLRNQSVTHLTIPSTVVYEYTDYNDKDDNGNYKIKHRTCTVNSIGEQVFYERDGLISVTIPDSVTCIRYLAFGWCNNLISVVIPGSVSSIENFAFYRCTSLTNVMIPSSVTNIGSGAFQGCSSLKGEIVIPQGVTSFGMGTFSECSGLNGVSFPNSVTNIGEYTFHSCSSLMSVTIPDGVTCIGHDGFNCGSVFAGCTSLTNVIIPNSVTHIGEDAFLGCSSLHSVVIPNSVTNISEYAFSSCGSLTNITLSTCLINIGLRAFQYCGRLTKVVIPESVTNIGEDSFNYCYGLTSITVPKAVMNIGGNAFYYSGLTNICFEGSPPSVNDNKYYDGQGYYIRQSGYCNGRYPSSYRSEWEEVIDANGYWHGLKMSMYEVPALTLTAESADWANGSITLCCTNADTSGSAHTYTLQYYDESNTTWVDVTGDDATVSIDANGNAHLTDNGFSSRLGGIPPVKYRVKEENSGRVSAECTTRARYGLAVGLGSYDSNVYASRRRNGLEPPTDLVICRNNAELANDIMTSHGGGIDAANMVLLTDKTAKKATVSNISCKWRSLAEDKTAPGDVVFFFIATHGAPSGALLAYDDFYTLSRFQKDLEPFRTGARTGVKVVIVLLNCHSEAMTSSEYDINYEYGSMCAANIIYIAVAGAKESEWNLHRNDSDVFWRSRTYSMGGEFFLNQGLFKHRADDLMTLSGIDGKFGNRDGKVDLLECARYMGALVVGRSDKNQTTVRYDALKSGIMKDTIMVSYEGHSNVSAPTTPQIKDVAVEDSTVVVRWESINEAQYYKVYYAKCGESKTNCIACCGGDDRLELKIADSATAKDRKAYTPLENDAAYIFSIVAANAGGFSPESSPVGPVVMPSAKQKTVYRVGLVAKGGTVSPKYKDVEDGSAVGQLPIPRREGWTFIGWFTKPTGGTEVEEGTVILEDTEFYAHWTYPYTDVDIPDEWLRMYPSVTISAGGDAAAVSNSTAANGYRTVEECYMLGIDPEDPDDDLKITRFEIGKDGKPIITLNHTEDGSGNSFEPRVRTLGKTTLSDAEEWREVPEGGDSSMRFFKVEVELP